MTRIVLFTALVSSILLSVIFVLRYLYTAKSKTRSIIINILTLAFSTLYCGLILEFIFYNYFVQSDGFAFTLASARWFQEYWKPINRFGYRDDDHGGREGRMTLFIVGDSFVAGHGIEDYHDRFSNQLADKLGNKWDVHNITKGNWSTQDEYQALINYPTKPDVVIFSYYINDIEGSARKAGIGRPSLIDPPPSIVAPIINHSYFLNYVYWRLYRYRFASEMRGVYFQYLENAFSDPIIWGTHQGDLLDLMDYARSNSAEMMFILFPNLADIEGSSQYTAQVGEFLRREGVKVVDLGLELTGRRSEDLIVSPFDAHPNVSLHNEVAEILYNCLQNLGR